MRHLPAASLFVAAVAAWEGAVRLFGVPGYVLPSPSTVLRTAWGRSDLLLMHARLTALEVLTGFALGAAAGVALALLMDAWGPARAALTPWVVASQTIPVFAVAPLLVLWFGYGLGSKTAMASLITFFPVALNVLDGLRPDPDTLRLFRTLGAGRLQLYLGLKLPAAVPSLFTGLKIAASVSTIAAVIGEWVGAAGGLGYLMVQANAQLRVDLVFASLLYLSVLGLALYGSIALLERKLSWKKT